MLKQLDPVGASAQGLSQFEKDRLKRIEENKKRMAAMLAAADFSLLTRPVQTSAAKSRKRKAEATPLSAEKRRSSRISNLPTPLYCIEEDITERTPGSRSRCSTAAGGRRCHGSTAAADLTGVDALYMSGKAGWKPECGSASLAAAEAATDAAVALQRQLVEQGTAACIKLMSASQVSGGFWSQLPLDLVQHYGLNKRTIHLHCDDKADQHPDTFRYSAPGSSSMWPVVYLPKGDGGGSGLSGGWRGFAIDMRLYPNDTVVYEVMDEAQTASAAAAGGGGPGEAAAVSTDDAGADSAATDVICGLSQETAASGLAAAAVHPSHRRHLRVHIFRASAYEAEDTAEPAGAETPDVTRIRPHQHQQQSGSVQVLPTTPESQAAELGLLPDASSQQQRVGDAKFCQSGSSDGSIDTASAAAGGVGAAAATIAAHSSVEDQLMDVPLAERDQVTAAAGSDQGDALMAAAEAGLLPRIKIARLPSSSSSKRQSISSARTADSADEQTAHPTPQQQRRPKKVSSAKRTSATASSRSVRLVPKPADPSELVPPPTAAERRRNNSRQGEFAVEEILGHRVNPSTGDDEFLISWVGFGPYWDSWEPQQLLTHQPGCYSWRGGQEAVPDKFRLEAC